jgi:hypothetical protein
MEFRERSEDRRTGVRVFLEILVLYFAIMGVTMGIITRSYDRIMVLVFGGMMLLVSIIALFVLSGAARNYRINDKRMALIRERVGLSEENNSPFDLFHLAWILLFIVIGGWVAIIVLKVLLLFLLLRI